MKTVCFATLIILVIAARKWRSDPSSELPSCIRQKLGAPDVSIEAYRFGSEKLFRVIAKGKEGSVYDESCNTYCEKNITTPGYIKDCRLPAEALFLNRYERSQK